MVEFVEDAKTLREIQVNRLRKNMVLINIFEFLIYSILPKKVRIKNTRIQKATRIKEERERGHYQCHFEESITYIRDKWTIIDKSTLF